MGIRIASLYSRQLLFTFLFCNQDEAQGIFVRADTEKQAKGRARERRNDKQFNLAADGDNRKTDTNLSGWLPDRWSLYQSNACDASSLHLYE